MKTEPEDLPDIGEAWIAAVEFNGPVDPALIKLKHKEIVLEAKEKREQELDPRGRHSLARDDPAERDRRSRDYDRLTIMALLGSEHLRQRLGDLYEGFDGTRGKGRDIAARLAELDEKLDRWNNQIMANAARDPLTGKAIFQYQDGRVIDEDGNDVPAERIAGVDFTGKTPAEEKAAYDATRTEVDELKEGLSNALGDLDGIEADLNRSIAENPDKAGEMMDKAERAYKGVDRRVDEIGERAKEIDQRADLTPVVTETANVSTEVTAIARPLISP